jgi:hypothetical protein
MSLVWGVILVAAFVAIGLVLARHVMRHRPRYIYSAAWMDEHWREQHERAKHRHSED